MLKIDLVEDAYQYVLKEKDKLKRRNQDNSQGKEKQDNLAKAKLSAIEDEPKVIDQKRRTRRCEFKGTCYRCGKEGHKDYECSQEVGDRRVVVNEVEDSIIELEQGENLLARRVLFGERTLEPSYRSNFLKTHCNSSGKICNVNEDGGSTDNLVGEEIVQKLGLK